MANQQEYRQKLWAKLLEEAKELETETSAEELADILEVVYTIADLLGVTPAEVEELRQKKADERGGFKDRIILEES